MVKYEVISSGGFSNNVISDIVYPCIGFHLRTDLRKKGQLVIKKGRASTAKPCDP